MIHFIQKQINTIMYLTKRDIEVCGWVVGRMNIIVRDYVSGLVIGGWAAGLGECFN